MSARSVDPMRLVRLACQVAEEKLGQNVLALDVRRQSSVADAFVFVSCTSHLHIRAVEDAIRERLKDEGARLVRTDGQRGHLWRALDYGAFLVHIMDQKTRDYYAIERLWDQSKAISFRGDAPSKPARTSKPAKSSARSPRHRKKSPRKR